MKHFYSIVFLSVLACSAYGQESLRDYLAGKLEGTEKWINEYKGFLDEVHPINVVVAKDGHQLLGGIEFLSSKTYIEMDDVSEKGGAIRMQYLDAYGDTLLSLDASRQQHNILGNLHTYEKVESFEINAYEDTNEKRIKDFSFMESYRNEAYYMSVTRIQNAPSININGEEYRGSCVDELCSRMQIQNISLDGIDYAEGFIINSGENHTLLLSDNNGGSKNIIFNEYRKVDFVTRSYLSYQDRISARLPNSEGSKLYDYLSRRLQLDASFFTPVEVERFVGENQFTNHKVLWSEITYFDTRIISGLVSMQSSDDSMIKEVSFIYDIAEDMPLENKDIFDRKFYKKNIKNTFNTVVIDSNGIHMFSNFDPIYGNKEKVYTLSEIKPYIKNKNLKKYLF